MSVEVKVPAVGESINEVTIAQWLKNDGEFVEMDEVICELESDKATFELTAEKSGTLKILAQEGETLSIGSVICKIEENGQAEKPTKADKKEAEPEPSKTESQKTGKVVEMKVPELAESITEVVLSSWLKDDGDYVELDEALAEIESDKATFELPAETQGILRVVAKEGDTLKIGDLICRIEETKSGTAKETTPAREETKTSAPQQGDSYASGHPSPAAAKILSEKGLSQGDVKGTGVGGRITKEDALNAEKKVAAPAEKSPADEEPQRVSGFRNQDRKKISQLRKTIAKRLVSVKNETAMLTTFNEVDMLPIMDIRKKYKEQFKDKFEVNLGFMSFFVKACCLALKEWPAVNAMIDGDEIVYNDFCDVSIAVSTPKGLVVPVIRNAEKMSFDQIEKEIIRLATRARDGKLSIEEMQGGTFTITNGGVFGSMLSTPIINAPQSAILGMHNIVERPMAVNGEVKIKPIMYVALSYDHRIIDGRESVSFLVRVKEFLEDPTRLLLGI